jgi:hypothetical protein
LNLVPQLRSSRLLLVITALGYLTYYAWFTAIIQQTTTALTIDGLYVGLQQTSSASYSGPALQIISGSTIIIVRLIPMLVAVALAVAFGLNVSFLWALHRHGGLRACLYLGGATGVGAAIASLASFSYLCCGWAASIVLIGTTFFASLSIYISVGTTILLGTNAYILARRYSVFAKSLG